MTSTHTVDHAAAVTRSYAAYWPRATAFSVGLAIGALMGAPAAVTACSSYWQKGAPRRKGDRKRYSAAPPTKTEPYPYDVFEGGATLETPLGTTRYYDCGPRDGAKVVLIHGVSTPSNVWKHVVPVLTHNGYRVLAFDLVGRGYSDGTDGTGLSEEELYINQMSYLLTSLNDWSGRFSIAGFSMGGRIAAAFARYFSNRIDRICLVAPAGMMSHDMLQPHLKSVSMGALTYSRARKLVSGPEVVGKMAPGVRGMVSWQLENHEGFADALTSSWLSGILLMSPAAPFNQLMARFGNRVQAVWGDKDNVCLPESAKSVPGLKVTTIKGGDHFMLIDEKRQAEVAEAILQVLGGARK